jgi:aspartate-semialdehyde dehydrogenase
MVASKKTAVGIVGATGLIGKEILAMLEEVELPMGDITLFASSKSRGEGVDSELLTGKVEDFRSPALEGLDVVFLAAPRAVCQKQIPLVVKAGAVAIDMSGFSSLDEEVPTVVADVNDDLLEEHAGVIASPAAPTVLISLLVEPLRDLGVPLRISGTLLLPASSEGKKGMDELAGQTIALLSHQDVPSETFPQRLAFNLIPDVDGFVPEGLNSRMETRVARELCKVLDEPDLVCSLTAVRVPVFVGQSVALEIELDAKVSLGKVRSALENAPGIALLDDPQEQTYPMPGNVAMTDDVLVGRIRVEEGERSRVLLWGVCDNLRKGAAMNAVQILVRCLDRNLLGKG